MTTGRPVMVQQLPAILDARGSHAFFEEIEPHLESDRPCVVLDFTEVRYLDSAGIELLLRCIEETMKRNGDVKLAAVSPEIAVIMEMTRVDRLFEIFSDCSDAVESFHRFSARALTPAVIRQANLSADNDQRRGSQV